MYISSMEWSFGILVLVLTAFGLAWADARLLDGALAGLLARVI